MVHPHSKKGNREPDEHLNESRSDEGEGFCRFCWEFKEEVITQGHRLSGLDFRCGDCDRATSPYYGPDKKSLDELRNDTFAWAKDEADVDT